MANKIFIGNDIFGGGSGSSSEPSAYIKSASVSNNTLTLVNKDNTEVEFIPQYTPTMIDTTLSIAGAAADAKAVGDAIEVLEYVKYSEEYGSVEISIDGSDALLQVRDDGVAGITGDEVIVGVGNSIIDIDEETITLSNADGVNITVDDLIEMNEDVSNLKTGKQDKLTTGNGIAISSSNVISATTDKTLSEDGLPADAKSVGDIVKKLDPVEYDGDVWAVRMGNFTMAMGEEGFDASGGDFAIIGGSGYEVSVGEGIELRNTSADSDQHITLAEMVQGKKDLASLKETLIKIDALLVAIKEACEGGGSSDYKISEIEQLITEYLEGLTVGEVEG